MDHHCLVLGTCIAVSNYKSFMLTLFYSTFLLIFSLLTSIKTAFFYTEELNVNLYFSIYLSFDKFKTAYYRFILLYKLYIYSWNSNDFLNLFYNFPFKVRIILSIFIFIFPFLSRDKII